MIKTATLQLPIYNTPDVDTFNLTDINTAHTNLEAFAVGLVDSPQSISIINQEVVNARGSEISLDDRLDKIDASINAIQIGGRNLLLKSADMKITDIASSWHTQSAIIGGADCTVVNTPLYSFRRCEGDLADMSITNLKSGQIALGIDFKTNKSDMLTFHFSVRTSSNTNSHDSNTITIPNTNNEWKRFYVVMNMPIDEIVRSRMIYFITGTANATINDTFSYRNIKLEKGNKATDWTPAIEDIDNAIALKADKITNGTTRPTPTHIGQAHFDTTLGKPIWCQTVDTPVWVDSTGTVC